VGTSFDCDPVWEGYPNCLHGGMIATLLDVAMTNCLFAHGKAAFTAELTVRFREVVITARPATLRAWLVQSSSRLHRMRAELQQDERVKVTATAIFLPSPALTTSLEVLP
jgi:acyl-coenzyme A thioesterase PaaI-like protein